MFSEIVGNVFPYHFPLIETISMHMGFNNFSCVIFCRPQDIPLVLVILSSKVTVEFESSMEITCLTIEAI